MTRRQVGRCSLALLLVSGALTACGGDGGGGPSGGSASVSGTVTNAITGSPLAGATVSVGAVEATTSSSGSYTLSGVSEGSVTLRSVLGGFVAYEATVALSTGSNSVNIGMTRQEVFTFPQYALYAPAGVDQVRGVLIALGGPRTTGFVTGQPVGAPTPDLEASSQALGQQLRTLATDSGLAILGTSQQGLADDPASDQALLQALTTAATASNRPELATAALLLLGISGGGPEAFGFVMRQPERAAALALRVPGFLAAVVSPVARQVPLMIWQAQYDSVVNNASATQVFEAQRSQGAIWGIGVEPNTVHYQQTAEVRNALVNWLRTAVGLRLPAASGGALRSVSENAGWLGNRATNEIAPFASYAGDPLVASWLPTAAAAQEWRELVTP